MQPQQGYKRNFKYGSGLYGQFPESTATGGRLPLLATKLISRSSVRLLFFAASLFVVGAFAFVLDVSTLTSIAGNSPQKSTLTTQTTSIGLQTTPVVPHLPQKKTEIPFNCSTGNLTRTCPANYYPKRLQVQDHDIASAAQPMCPEYFRWIHEDLQPWRKTGITKEMVERARMTASFRLVILNGKAYVETYLKPFQCRDTFTQCGILQLLRKYPGKLPDLDLMFECSDWPVISKKNYSRPNATASPPLFRYCADDSTLDIVFPDWSFWGWSNLRPNRTTETFKSN